jgi:hypothetical protein
MAKGKRTNIDLQNITYKSKDRVTRTPLKTGSEYKCSGSQVFTTQHINLHAQLPTWERKSEIQNVLIFRI